jgi:hypothetical protein
MPEETVNIDGIDFVFTCQPVNPGTIMLCAEESTDSAIERFVEGMNEELSKRK